MDEAFSRLEAEMAVLARRIENSSRRSTTFRRMDRAAYLITRTLEGGPATVNEVAKTLSLDGSTVTRQVAAMEARGQATRSLHPDDGRAWLIRLTASGRREMDAIGALRRQRFADYLADWSADDVDHFSRLLQRFNLSLAKGAMAEQTTDDASVAPSGHRARNDHHQSVVPSRRRR